MSTVDDRVDEPVGEPEGSTVEVAGRVVANDHGDAAAEYAAVRGSVGVALRDDRARIRLWGRDPARMLHGLITNDLLAAPPGRGVYAAMLTAKGRMIAELRAFRRDGGELLVELPREALAGTAEQLRRFVPPLFARWADASAEVRQLGAYGPAAHAALEAALGAALPALEEDAFAEPEWNGARLLVAGTRDAGGEPGYEIFVPGAEAGALWAALRGAAAARGGRAVGRAALETLRIEAGRPRYGAELGEDTIPTEAYEQAGLMPRAVSFTKGCYTGQEVIVRIAHRGHVNRHLRGLLPPGGGAEPGTPLFHPDTGREVGRVTSAAHSPLLGRPVALGYVRRGLEPGASVRLGAADGPAATVSGLPFRAGEHG